MFSEELVRFVAPEYQGASHPQHNPEIGPLNFTDLPTIYDSYDVVKDRLVAKLSHTLNEDFSLAGYTANSLATEWKKTRGIKEWLERVAGYYGERMMLLGTTNKGKTPLDEELGVLEDKRRRVLEDIRSVKVGDNTGSNPVALLPLCLSKATLEAMNAVNASFPDFGKLVQIELKTPDPEDPTRYADYEVLPLDQYLVHADEREKDFPGTPAWTEPLSSRQEEWKNATVQISQRTMVNLETDRAMARMIRHRGQVLVDQSSIRMEEIRERKQAEIDATAM